MLRYRGGRNVARRGAMVILFAVLIVVVVGMVAFSVDIGWIALVRNQLQVAADAAAIAGVGELNNSHALARQAAKSIGEMNRAGGTDDFVSLADGDIELGSWNTETKTFTPGGSAVNAVKVTARRDLPLFFAPVLGVSKTPVKATAIAFVNPRDIAFVIDLSGSMNNDSEVWATGAINTSFPGYPTIGSDLMQDLYNDFGYGAYPGAIKHIGEDSIPASQLNNNAYNYIANTYLLNNAGVPTTYRVASGDSSSTRKTKAYRWIIDYQLASIMPNAKPAPSSATNLPYWTDYLDFVINGSPAPPSQATYRMSSAANPYADAWPDLTSSSISGRYNKVGYLTYVQFMMDYGWNKKAAGNTTNVPLSRLSADCPWKVDDVPSSPGYGLSFPPREQPTHAVRLAVMAAVDKIAAINKNLSEVAKDHVSVITFDTAAGSAVKHPLSLNSCDYAAAKASLRDLQAVADDASSTASENGLVLAKQHLDPATNPTGARSTARRLVIFLSDGIPNIKQSSNTAIDNYASANPLGEWFTGGGFRYERNAVLMQIGKLKALDWKTHAVGVGLGADRTLMDRMARMAGTGIADPANPGGPKISPYATGNPADYQTRLTEIFNTIVGAPSVRLAQ
jgi:hypothetical protein